MLRSIKDILGYEIQASDGQLGKVEDFFFDDLSWTIRYIVADTGGWLSGRRVLIAPEEAGQPDWETQLLPVALTTERVRKAPSVSTDLPVSRQKEAALAKHYGWVPYWEPGLMAWPGAAVPPSAPAIENKDETEGEESPGDPDLRSANEVMGYNVQAAGEDVGEIVDFIAETDTWILRYIVMDTQHLVPGKKILVSPNWTENIEWDKRHVHLELTPDEVRDSPEFDPSAPINRRYEAHLYDYYGRPRYWE